MNFKSRIERKNGHVIKMLTQTDLYKLTMQQAFLHQCPNVIAKYRFKCRNEDVKLGALCGGIREEVKHLCKLRYTQRELDYLSSLGFFKGGFIEYLRMFKLNEDFVSITTSNGNLFIEVEGPITSVSPFEIYLLRIIHELYSTCQIVSHLEIDCLAIGRENLKKKLKMLPLENLCRPTIVDFGLRRSFLDVWHEEVIATCVEENAIVGTSDVAFAMLYNLTPIGTFAHEWVTAFQGMSFCQLKDSQKVAFQTWANEYRGDLGIALSDTLGTKKFLEDFDLYFAKLFDGLRHDSGDPIEWGHKMINMYHGMNIDPKTKTLVFSDGLDFPAIMRIYEEFSGIIKVSFGIGTDLTNDVGIPALQNVIKLVEVNGNPVAKISDNPSKTMCENQSFLNYLRTII